ncbi:MAG: amino acid ABC transporter ATP-binding protein [Firmicutes bacterium]|nr:amino acid ABC transporter ATP-binding protein [Bacillota bacterium]
MYLLEANNIHKSFGETHVLKGVDLVVEEGQVVSIIGPSGSGKSTLLRCMTQLETADSGSISICGRTMTEDRNGTAVYSDKNQLRQIMLDVGLVFQNFQLFPHWSVLRNLTDAQIRVLGRKKEEAEAVARELLSRMKLSEKESAYPCQLSGGQQQRVAIARALAMSPKILFFDEPTSALDPELIGEVLEIIRDLARQHMTMVIVTHEMTFAREISDKVMFLDHGSVLAFDTPEKIFAQEAHSRIQAFLSLLNKK